MKLIDRQHVEGTDPPVYIGHRVFRDRSTGAERACRPWYAEFCINGRACYRSLRTRHKAAAIKAAHLINPHAPVAKAPPAVLLNDLVKQYFDMLRARNRSHLTVGKYKHALDRLVQWGKTRDVTRGADLTEKKFWAFLEFLRDYEGLSEKTRYTHAIIIKQLTRWGHRMDLLPINPLNNAQLTQPPPREQPCFTPQQLATLIARAQGEFRAVIAFLAFTGCRYGEMAQLRWSDILFEAGTHGVVVVRRGGSTGSTKSKRIRRIPLHPRLRPLLLALPHHGDLVFMNPPCNRNPQWHAMSERYVLAAIKGLCKSCKFPNPDQYKIHTMRHAFASCLARSRSGYKHALDLMGHRESDVLDLYIKLFDSDLEAAVEGIALPEAKHGEKAA